ncbi:MAG: hypothetical protein ACP5KN_00380, partial [Armatimonadota bacterium]
GAGSGWQPRPEDLDLFWHRGLYVDDVEVRLGVHRTDHGAATASLVIGDGTGLHSGYAVRAEQPSTTEPVTVKLMRAGEWISTQEAEAWSEEGYVLSLRRVGNVIVAGVDGQTICQLRDPEPLEGLDRVGFRRDDAIIDPGDVAVLSSAVRTYTFEEAPVDWQAESGTWEVSTRWSCQPEWTWLAGWNQTGQALTHTRWRATGRQMIDVYVGAKMMPKPDGKGHYEELRDLHFGLCGDGEGGGYHIVLGGQNNTVSSIRRNGTLVAQSTARSIPQSERHNNWLLVTILRDGPTISARIWDREVLSFTDNRPLEGGVVSVGTENNGIIVPRVTIYGSPAR